MKYDFTQIPPSWRYCFHAGCPMRGECLRYQTALQLPDDYQWGQAVFPPALKDGQCRFFRKDEPVTLATGFVTGNVRQDRMFVALRPELMAYLGGNGSYYLYRNGRRWLSPDQQQLIRELFLSHGYQEEVRFARTFTDYYWL